MTFLQQGLIDKVLRVTNMQDCNDKPNLACTKPFGTDADGPRCQQSWDYTSVNGIIMYLTSNSRPNIQYAIHNASNLPAIQEQPWTICRYLKGTRNKSLVFKPNKE